MWQLHQFPLCPFSRKVRILLGEKGVGCELVRESPWERRDEFLDMTPAGQTPVMTDPDRGILLIDSMAICEYFEETVEKSAMLNGTADRRTQLTVDSQWWDLDPGTNSFRLDAQAGTGTITVTWRDTFY